jgi:GT2 family glycosyltransferase
MASIEIGWPGVSVVIPTWNGAGLLAAYLPSVRAALLQYPGAWECLIIDDGGTDASALEVPKLFPEARYMRRERNEGFSAAANTGFAAARHELVLLLNNDILVEPGFLTPLAQHFWDAGDSLFAAVALQLNPATEDKVNPAEDGCRALLFQEGELRLPSRTDSAGAAVPTALANGGCSLFSRDRVRDLGGFCPIFNPFYYEDAELSVQALRRGWRIVFEPASKVLHRPNTTTARHSTKLSPTVVRNAFFFHWLLLDHIALWTKHLLCMAPRLASRTLQGRFEYAQGLGLALGQLGPVLDARRARSRGAKLSMRSLLSRWS